MKRLLPAIALAGLVLGVCTVGARAFPKPSVNKIAWELDVQTGLPQRIAVRVPGEAAPKAYWYMPITVTNNTGVQQQFLPEIDLIDDRGNVFRSDKGIPNAVFDEIKRVTGKKLLVPLGKASGPIREGADEAIDTVAIWPEPLERMGSFSIFVGGLSGEAVWYKDGKELPMNKADWVTQKPDQVGEILRKTLELDFQVPGDEFYQGKDVVIQKNKDWVMR